MSNDQNKRRVAEIPYYGSDETVIYEIIDEMQRKNWEITRITREPNAEISRFPRHSHNWLEVIIPVQGCADVTIRNQRHIVLPGYAVIIPPLMIHESRRNDFNEGYYGFVIHYYYRYLQFMIEDIRSLSFETVPVPFDQKWLEYLYSVSTMMENKDSFWRLRANIMMDEILLGIAERHSCKNEKVNEKQLPLVQKAMFRIEETAFRNYRIEEVALSLHVTYAYLSRCFRKETGLTMTEYRDEIRMEKALEMIRNTEISLEDISMQLGYEDYAPFSRRFRSYYGCTPSSMRRNRS